MTLLEKLIAVALLALLASFSAPVAIKAGAQARWRLQYIAAFHQSRIARAVELPERGEYHPDVQLDDGQFKQIMRW